MPSPAFCGDFVVGGRGCTLIVPKEVARFLQLFLDILLAMRAGAWRRFPGPRGGPASGELFG